MERSKALTIAATLVGTVGAATAAVAVNLGVLGTTSAPSLSAEHPIPPALVAAVDEPDSMPLQTATPEPEVIVRYEDVYESVLAGPTGPAPDALSAPDGATPLRELPATEPATAAEPTTTAEESTAPYDDDDEFEDEYDDEDEHEDEDDEDDDEEHEGEEDDD